MSPSTAMKGLFGLLPTPYTEDLEIHIDDLRSVADFCCRSGQHGIVWPVMVGDFWYLGEEERIRGLDAVMTEVDGRLPLVFGCGGISVPQILIFARAAQKAGVDSVVTLPPSYVSGTREVTDMYKRMADCFDGPIMIQNHDTYGPMSGEQVAALVDEVPQIKYIKEERQPGPKHIAETRAAAGDRLEAIFGGAAGKYLPDEIRRGADGNMPACELGDVLATIFELSWAGEDERARDLHRRVLPLVNLETPAFVRYILKRRGVLTSEVLRAPAGARALDEEDKREISILIEAIADDIEDYPFGPE